MRAAAALLAAGLLAACGSTAQQTGRQVSASDRLTNPDVLATGAVDEGTTAVAGTGGGGGGTTATTAPAASAGIAAPSAGAQSSAAVVGDGSPILLGLPYIDQQQGSTITAGIGNGLATGDLKAMTEAMVEDLNARGGVLGHPVELVLHQINTSQSQDQYEQSACATFTEDNHVHIALGASSSNYLECLTDGGAAVVTPGWSNELQARYQELRYVLQPNAIALDRLARIMAEHYVAQGLFESTLPVKLGVLYFDLPQYHEAEAILEAELAERGVKVASKQAFNWVGEVADIAPTQSQVQNAVLRFRSEGVTHVIGLETNAWLIGFFGVGASGQGYYPRYGYTSNEVLSNVHANVPHRALEGARFIGWWPAQDLLDPSLYSPRAQACLAFMQEHGIETETGNQRADALGVCEAIGYIEAALTAGGEPISRDSLLAGARSVSDYESVNTFRIGPSYDGVAAVRHGQWDTECECFAYTSDLISVE